MLTPYYPLLEGSPGQLYISNQSGSTPNAIFGELTLTINVPSNVGQYFIVKIAASRADHTGSLFTDASTGLGAVQKVTGNWVTDGMCFNVYWASSLSNPVYDDAHLIDSIEIRVVTDAGAVGGPQTGFGGYISVTANPILATAETFQYGLYQFPNLPGGGAVNYPAATSLFSLSGDNGSWANRLSINPNGAVGFYMEYNGNPPDPNIQTTNLTITSQDIAWFNTRNNSIDAFQYTSQGGGARLQIPIVWLTHPTFISSTVPGTLRGDGGTYQVTVNLNEPLTPMQASASANFWADGGLTVLSHSANTNSAGFITGWTVTVRTPVVGATAFPNLYLTASSQSLTFLQGPAFVTTNVTYIDSNATGRVSALVMTP